MNGRHSCSGHTCVETGEAEEKPGGIGNGNGVTAHRPVAMADTGLGCPATPELLLHVHGARSIRALRSAPLTASIRRRSLSPCIPSSCPNILEAHMPHARDTDGSHQNEIQIECKAR